MAPCLGARRAAAALGAAALAAAQTPPQTFSYSGSTFDLSAMTQNMVDGPYKLTDERDAYVTYSFNFFSMTKTPDGFMAQCTSGRDGNANGAFAWQVETHVNSPQVDCYRLGSNVSDLNAWAYSIMDPVYPNRGVALTYPGGDRVFCPVGMSRSLTIELTCDPTIAAPPPRAESVLVQERNDCQYFVTLRTIAGCPTQCITGGSLCNGHGVCGYNQDAVRSQCFCYAGFSGDTCGTQNKDAGVGVETILLIIVCIVLAGVLGLIGFMFLKLRRLQVDPAAYDDLQGRFNELGQLA